MAFLLDDLLLAPMRLPVWLAQRVRQMAVDEITDESKVQEELLEIQMRFELDEMTEEEYRNKETRLMERLDKIRQLKKQEQSGRKSKWQPTRRQSRR